MLDAELHAQGWQREASTDVLVAPVDRVVARIQGPSGYVIADVDGVLAGVGLVVCQHDWAGVFCMATDQLMRRRGIARAGDARSRIAIVTCQVSGRAFRSSSPVRSPEVARSHTRRGRRSLRRRPQPPRQAGIGAVR